MTAEYVALPSGRQLGSQRRMAGLHADVRSSNGCRTQQAEAAAPLLCGDAGRLAASQAAKIDRRERSWVAARRKAGKAPLPCSRHTNRTSCTTRRRRSRCDDVRRHQ